MPRVIPSQLVTALSASAGHDCILIKITPVQPGYAAFGITDLDEDVIYDDNTGAGPMTYLASVGAEPTVLESSADLSVGGGEVRSLMPVFDTPVSEADIIRGAYDFAEFVAYLVNYQDLTPGRHAILKTGTLGKNKTTDAGLSWVTELRDLADALKQSITEKWSLTCRATFGSKQSGLYRPLLQIVNGGFDVGAAGWAFTSGGNATIEWVSTGGRTTPGCLRFRGSGESSDGSVVGSMRPLADARPITATAWGRIAGGTPGSSFSAALLWYDIDSNYLDVSVGPERTRSQGSGNLEASVTASPPVGAAFVAPGVFCNGSASSTQTEIFVDDLSWNLSGAEQMAPAGSVVERFPCNFDIDPLWQEGEVGAVGMDPTYSFTTSGLSPVYGGAPGMVRWITGANAGRSDEADSFTDTAGVQAITLMFGTMFPVSVGDTFEFRDDCPRDEDACRVRWNWANFRGEPTIPVADAAVLSTGGGSAGGRNDIISDHAEQVLQ